MPCPVQGLGSGTVTLGIHIAAPGLAILPGSPTGRAWRRNRLSTVYMPGYKITMLPDEVVQTYTLDEGRDRPGGVAVRHLRRGHAGRPGSRDQAGARAVSVQPAPRPARPASSPKPAADPSIQAEARHRRADARASWTFALPPGPSTSRPSARWCAASPRPSTAPTTASKLAKARGGANE